MAKLIELNPQPGDVFKDSQEGFTFEVESLEDSENLVYGKTTYKDGLTDSSDYWFLDGGIDTWEVVSRAVDTQVQTDKRVWDMTDAELGAIVRAYASGADVQFKWYVGEGWTDIKDPSWIDDAFYRIKPKATRQKIMMNASEENRLPYINTYMSDPSHNLTLVWKDGKLVDIEFEEA